MIEIHHSDDDNIYTDEEDDNVVLYKSLKAKRIKVTPINIRKGKYASCECIDSIVQMNVSCNITIQKALECFVICENTFKSLN